VSDGRGFGGDGKSFGSVPLDPVESVNFTANCAGESVLKNVYSNA
jgi:hypothetical protein